MNQFQVFSVVGVASVGVASGVLLGAVVPSLADEQPKTAPIPRLSEVDQPLTNAAALLAQEPNAIVRVTGVRLNPIESGIQVILETAEQRSVSPEFKTEGNAKVADVPGVVLALPNGQSFEATTSVPGISSVSVTQLEGDRIQIRAIGETIVPVVTVRTEAPSVAAMPEEPEEEVVVTGDRPSPYRVPRTNTATKTDTPLRAEVLNPDIKLHTSGDKGLWQEIIAPVNHRTPTT